VTKSRILIADDHPLVRRGLCQVLEREPDLEVVAQAADGAEAVAQALEHDVDLAILDVAMPRLTGIQVAEQLAARQPRTRVLILSMYDSDQYFQAAARAGAAGYLLKAFVDEEVVDACRRILRGERFISSRSTDGSERPKHTAIEELLTRRELEILKLVAEGDSSQQIAEQLSISIKTVERHRSNIMDKLKIRDRVGLTRYAIRRGLVEP
jgi:DNA-binding NarL/FixJ family response regulator